MSTLANYMPPSNVLLDLDVADRASLFNRIGQHVGNSQGVAQQTIVHCLTRREQAGSTGLGQGLAIPHARIEGLAGIQVLYVRLKTPIHFAAPDRMPVNEALVLLVPAPTSDEHLKLLAAATELFSDPGFRARLHASDQARDVVRLFSDWPTTPPTAPPTT